MRAETERSPAAERFALLVADVYELAGELSRCGELLAADAGQTGARWKVLSAASVGGQTVAQLARRLGLARQSVQRVADALEEDGLLRYEDNPDHSRAPHVVLTQEGRSTLTLLSAAAAKWEDPLAARLKRVDLERTRDFIRALMQLIRQHPPAANGRRT
jgi:DNA-binding MarR family transcriptional regulator